MFPMKCKEKLDVLEAEVAMQTLMIQLHIVNHDATQFPHWASRTSANDAFG